MTSLSHLLRRVLCRGCWVFVKPKDIPTRTPAREKVAWQVIGKRAGSWARTEISKRYGGWQQRGGNGERAGMAEEE